MTISSFAICNQNSNNCNVLYNVTPSHNGLSIKLDSNEPRKLMTISSFAICIQIKNLQLKNVMFLSHFLTMLYWLGFRNVLHKNKVSLFFSIFWSYVQTLVSQECKFGYKINIIRPNNSFKVASWQDKQVELW